jgi:hypothetical protein
MENLRITIEVTFEEGQFVLNELEKFRAEQEVKIYKPEPEPKPLKLKYGKRYRRRDGQITARLMESNSETYQFTDGEELWKSDGSYHPLDNCHPLDLIEEVVEQTETQPEPQPEPQPFKLEYGKRYKRRDGRITAPLWKLDSEVYPFTDGKESWTPRGCYFKTEEIHAFDLFEEVI